MNKKKSEDIRNYFLLKSPQVSQNEDINGNVENTEENTSKPVKSVSSSIHHNAGAGVNGVIDINQYIEPHESNANIANDNIDNNDIGNYLESVSSPRVLTNEERYNLLTNTWCPSASYDFKSDLDSGRRTTLSRIFRYHWLTEYSPWLAYSKKLKGGLCKNCVLFRPRANRGLQGAFITKSCTRYNDFNNCARDHVKTEWHRKSVEKSQNFLATWKKEGLRVDLQLDTKANKIIINNRQKITSILKTIIFCATHDIALRGKNLASGNFIDLLHFRVDAGDIILKQHFETAAQNAQYTSPLIQNELINLTGEIIVKKLIQEMKAASSDYFYSILADETADISGKEQLSIGIRYFNKNTNKVHEEFVGFVPIESCTAQSISEELLKTCSNLGLEKERLVGQGYDGAANMSGHRAGVQALIKAVCPKAFYYHCSAHILNLVINDLTDILQVQNTIGTIKEVIRFFRESPKRRNMVPNVPLLCETRWSHKYRSIRVFFENFKVIISKLEEILNDSTTSSNTRTKAYQLFKAAEDATFLITFSIIEKYSSLLEPVANSLQAVQLNLLEVQNHINELLKILKKEREKAEDVFKVIFKKFENMAKDLDIEIKVPRRCGRQTVRENHPANTPEEYFRRSIFIPYLDLLIKNLEERFSQEHKPGFSLFELHPSRLIKLTEEDFLSIADQINSVYKIDNFSNESYLWYSLWKQRAEDGSRQISENIDLVQVVSEECHMFPAIQTALIIALTLPATTCTNERSFSTLRRVKTWLRSTMTDNRLSGLCLMSIHREFLKNNEESIIQNVVDTFGRQPRRLQFLFSNNV